MNKNSRAQHKPPIFFKWTHKSIFEVILIVLLFSVLMLEKNKQRAILSSLFVDSKVQQEAPALLRMILEQGQYPVATFSVFSHGRSGQLFLEGAWLEAPQIAEFLKGQIGAAKNLHIYGCKFAKGKKGKAAVRYLKESLGVEIAASTNSTGQHGDWVLEVQTKEKPAKTLAFSTLKITLQDTDNDGVNDAIDIDDDNDGILDVNEVDLTDGLSAVNAFTRLGMAQNVTTAGIYFFNLSGTAFSSYVDENGYVQIAISFGGDTAGNLPQSTALTNSSKGILTPTVLASLTDMNTVRISGTSQNPITPVLDVISTNATLIQRVQNNATLHKGTADNTINNNWTGTAADALTVNATCNSTHGNSLHQNIAHTCGSGVSGIHWIPSIGLVVIKNGEGNIGASNSLRLWVQADLVALEVINDEIDTDGDGLFDHRDLDSDNDGIPDNIEAQSTTGYIAPNTDNAATYLTNNGLNSAYLGGLNPVNTSGTGEVDFLELDSDNDGVFDILESGRGLTDANADGMTDGSVGINGLDNSLDNGDTYLDVNGNLDNSQTDNFPDADSDVLTIGDVDYRDADADNDGLDNDIDIDDDDDGILDVDEVDLTDGLSAVNAFTSLGMARNVTSAGVYYFNLSGTAFSTYVDANGYVQVAIDNSGSVSLPQGTSLTNLETGILNPTALASLIDITEIRITGVQEGAVTPLLDITTSNSTLLQRIRNNETLHKGQVDNALHNDWTGVAASAINTNATCTSPHGTSLPQNIAHLCGVVQGLHWVPILGYRLIRLAEGNVTGVEGMQLWVRADAIALEIIDLNKDTDGDGIINSLDLDSDNDGIPDNVEGQISTGYIAPQGVDTDNDGLDDAYDPDQGGARIIPVNTDGIDTVDYLDLDADNDGIPDNIEAQTTRGYIAPIGVDINGNGLDDNYDTNIGGTAILPVNTDNTDLADYRDLDSDNDGVFDIVESGSDLTDINLNGMTDGSVGINGLDNTVETTDDYSDVNGIFDATQTDNFTDSDGDVLTIGDVDYRDATLSGIPMITQTYQHTTDRWIEITNVHTTNEIEANAIKLILFTNSTGDQTGVLPSATYTYPVALAAGESVLIRNTTAVITNTHDGAAIISNNAIANFDDANDIFVLSTQTNSQAYALRYDEIYGLKNSSSYVRNDDVVLPTETYDENNWTVFVDDLLDPSANPPERHYEAPLVTEIPTANTEANIQLGLHRINNVFRVIGIWFNGVADRSREVYIFENHEENTKFNARELYVQGNFTINNTSLIVSDSIRIVDYSIRLVGNSQLIQTHSKTSSVSVLGLGNILIDQESPTASIYRYNYWSSPVVENGTNTFRIGSIMKDGTLPTSPTSTVVDINFIGGYDGANTSPISIASYWLYNYSNGTWNATGNTGVLNRADGYLLKGPGVAQNYTFTGIPNDGNISSDISPNTHKLIGNPYPSAIDATKFIRDNISVIDGTLYFWEHTGELGTTTAIEGHVQSGYEGGYATRNLTMGIAANTISEGTAGLGNASYQIPGPYIAVAQGFFVQGTAAGGTIVFDNSLRKYQPVTGSGTNSVFLKGGAKRSKKTNLPIVKLGLDYTNAKGQKLHRQIGISFKKGNTFAYESGYDSEIYDLNTDENDMYWNFGDVKNYVIAGVEAFDEELEIPITLQIKSETPVAIKLDTFENIEGPISLYDALTNTYSDLKNEAATLALSKGTYTNRFYLSFKNSTLSVDGFNAADRIQLYHSKQDNSLQLETKNELVQKVIVYNNIGQLCQQWKFDSNKTYRFSLPLKDLAIGLYIVKVETNARVITKKIMIFH